MNERRHEARPEDEARERLRELLALAQYGELDEREAAELAALRARSPQDEREARAYAAELAAGLGLLAERAAAARELPPDWPPDWKDRLRRDAARRRAAFPAWLGAAAAFAAGALLVWAARGRAPEPEHAARLAGEFARFASDEPPPIATAGGGLTRLSEYLR